MNLVSRGLGDGNIVARGLGGSVGTQTYQKVWVDHIDARPLLFPPTVLVSDFDIGVPLLDAAPTIHTVLVRSTIAVEFPLLSAAPTLYEPALVPTVAIPIPLLDASALLFAPVIYSGTAFIEMPLIANTAVMYLPQVNTGVLLDIIEMTLGIAPDLDFGLGIMQALSAAAGVVPMATYTLGVETQPDDYVETITVVDFTVGIGAATSIKVGVRQAFDAAVGIDESFNRNLTQTLDY